METTSLVSGGAATSSVRTCGGFACPDTDWGHAEGEKTDISLTAPLASIEAAVSATPAVGTGDCVWCSVFLMMSWSDFIRRVPHF